MAQAGRIEGVTPGALTAARLAMSGAARRRRRRGALSRPQPRRRAPADRRIRCSTVLPGDARTARRSMRLLRKWQRTINLVGTATLDAIWTGISLIPFSFRTLRPRRAGGSTSAAGRGLSGARHRHPLRRRTGRGRASRRIRPAQMRVLEEVFHVKQGRPRSCIAAASKRSFPNSTSRSMRSAPRALAPLPTLLDYAGKLIEKGATGVFLEGRTGGSGIDRFGAGE